MADKEKKKIQRIAAGEVVTIQYMNGKKPCDKCICLLLSPLTIAYGKGCDDIKTVFAIDMDTELFLPQGEVSNNSTALIVAVKDRKLKAWFFSRVCEILDEAKKKKKD